MSVAVCCNEKTHRGDRSVRRRCETERRSHHSRRKHTLFRTEGHWEECVRYFFFFQAEDGIRDLTVTGVQTCALPIYCLNGYRYYGPPYRHEPIGTHTDH